MEITLGSLFDGAGTCPFAAKQFGIKTLWSSEIEPFPLQVTAKRFPEVQQLGDITKINGGEIPPVDIITFGSPCQDLSVAGKRAGIEGARSGLFMEAVRIMREMRDATKGKYPRFAMWENVPGAFSSNNGDDFRTVLEELAKVKDGKAVIPRPTDSKGGQQRWTTAGHILADDYSIAWRTLDAQYWGIPQRRRRIYLVADFRGESAAKILFKRNGLSRNFAESRDTWQGLSRENTYSTLCADRTGQHNDSGSRENGLEVTYPLILENHPNDSRIQVDDSGTIQTLTQAMGMGGGNVPLIVCGVDTYNQTQTGNVAKTILAGHTDCDGVPCIAVNLSQDLVPNEKVAPCLSTGNTIGQANLGVVYAIDRAAFNQGENAKYDFCIQRDVAQTLVAKGAGAVCHPVGINGDNCSTLDGHYYLGCGARGGIEREVVAEKKQSEWVVRRLTPTECARLQGMPDWWCSDIEHRDAPEYKMWGNGMALPNVMYVMEGLAAELRQEKINQILGE